MKRFFALLICWLMLAVPSTHGRDKEPKAEPEYVAATFGGSSRARFVQWLLDRMEFSTDNFREFSTEKFAISAIITKQGKLKEISVYKYTDDLLAARITKLMAEAPDWSPATLDGKPQESKLSLPIDICLVPGAEGKLVAEDRVTYTQADKFPTFEGGDRKAMREWVLKRVDAPIAADGRVADAMIVATFVVEKNGKISNLKIPSGEKNKALARQIDSLITLAPCWSPALVNGQPIRYREVMRWGFGALAAEAEKDEPAGMVERMPAFKGGDLRAFRSWVMRSLTYPQQALREGISGRVVISFVVEIDGSLSGFAVEHSPSPILSEAVIDVLIKSPKWTPGYQYGRPVRVKFTLPIDFNSSQMGASSSALSGRSGSAYSGRR